MPKYILQIKDLETFIDEFETLEEAIETKTNFELDDRETNSNIEYEIILKEDYIQNKITNLKTLSKEIQDKNNLIWIDIKNSFENYLKEMNNLLKQL